jgi:hypothetical protein
MPRPKIALAIPIAIIVIGFIDYFCFHDTVIPIRSMAHLPENQLGYVPAPMNSSLGFGKLYYISLPSYYNHVIALIVDGQTGRII